jgi:Flp pilus assembly pilin Flp
MKRFLRLWNGRRGSSMMPYGLVVGLVAIVAILAVQRLGGSVSDMLGEAGDDMQAAIPEGVGSVASGEEDEGEGEEETGGGDTTAPVIAPGQSFTAIDGAAANTALGTVAATDDVAVTGFAITAGDSGGYFAISPSGVLSLTSAGAAGIDPGVTPSYTLTIEASDAASNTGSASVSVTVQGAQLYRFAEAAGSTGDLFGYSSALSGNRGVVGAVGWSSAKGIAYYFDLSSPSSCAGSPLSCTQTAGLWASDGSGGDRFGHRVGVSGTVGVVSATHHNAEHGAVYVYDLGTAASCGGSPPLCVQNTKLVASDQSSGGNARLGYGLSISGNTVLAGAYNRSGGQGAGYLYDLSNLQGCGGTPNTCTQNTKLVPTDVASGTRFGYSLFVDGTRAVADGDNGGGYAYYFDLSNLVGCTGSPTTCNQTAKLSTSDHTSSDNFGRAIGLSGSRLVVGAADANTGFTGSGAAYYYDLSSLSGCGTVASPCTQIRKFVASDRAASDGFGFSVAVSGSRALIGSWKDDSPNADGGSLYYFDLDNPVGCTGTPTTCTETAKIVSQGNAANDQFGYSVAASSSRALVGAAMSSPSAGSGAAYLFDISQW